MAGAPQEQAGRLQRGLDPKLKGVVVSEVARDGLAANAGLLQVRVRTAKGTRFVTLPK